MEISVIASGSNGNCCLIQEKDTSILVDAGKSGLEIESRMNKLGKSLEGVNAILLTHAHSDHVAGAGVLSRRYGIPVYMTKEVFSDARYKLGEIERKTFSNDKKFTINGIEIRPVNTSHDVSSCGFVIKNFGIMTDSGVVTKQMETIMPKLNAVLLEFNHDIDMLINGAYPYYLKQRILSDKGHLNNIDASNLIQKKGENLSLALLGHLSGNNNTPEVAKSTYENLVKRKIEAYVCSRDKESGNFDV